jgi:Domain of unknown function (DUF4394)
VHGRPSRHGRRLLALAAVVFSGLAAAGPAHAGLLASGLTTDNRIVTFDTAAPGQLLSSVQVAGLQAGESLVGIDYRPFNGLVYAISNLSRAYFVVSTGQATPVGGVLDPVLSGTAFGIDFNPTVDRLRIVSNAEQNMRFNPVIGTIVDSDGATGGIQPDTNLSPPGDVVAAAYTNNDLDPTTATTLFGIDSVTDSLVGIGGPNGVPSPNLGAITTIGPLGVDTSDRAGLDVPLGASTTAFASLIVGGVSRLYSVNLATGAATLVGDIGPSGTVIADITVSSQAAPSPAAPVPPPSTLPPPDLAPVLSSLSLTNRTFAAVGVRSKSRAAATRVPRGTTFRFTLSETARVRVAFARATAGRRVGRSCLAATRARRKRPKCTRYVALGSISTSGVVGRNSVKFSGRLKGRALAPGSYRASLTATDAIGQRSPVRTVSFRVVRP